MTMMKKAGMVIPALLLAALVFTGCPMDSDDDDVPYLRAPETIGNPVYEQWLPIADRNFTEYFGSLKLYGAAYGNDRYVVVGQDGTAAWSRNGIYWAPSQGTDVYYYSSGCNTLAFVNGRFYACGAKVKEGEGKPHITSSANGDVWTEVPQDVFTGEGCYIFDIAYGNGVYVMVSDGFSQNAYPGPKLAWSEDLENWTVADNITTGLPKPLYQVEYGNGIFVAVGGDADGGVTAWSENGKDWTIGNFNNGTQSRALAFGGGKFVSVGRAHSDLKNAKFATDGKNWTTYDLTWSQYINTLVYGGGFFLVGGNHQAKIASDPSADANWTEVTGLQDIFMNGTWIDGAGWGNNRFIVVGDQGTAAISTN